MYAIKLQKRFETADVQSLFYFGGFSVIRNIKCARLFSNQLLATFIVRDLLYLKNEIRDFRDILRARHFMRLRYLLDK